MPIVEVFATSNAARDTLARHQSEHPDAWTPELAELTASWTVVVQAIVGVQEELQSAAPDTVGVAAAFGHRCASEPELWRHLDVVCERNLHSFLLAWVMEGVRERLSSHAVPRFWSHYAEAAELIASREGMPSAAAQRRCQAAFFAAVAELWAFVRAQLELISLLELRRWRDGLSGAAGVAPSSRGAGGISGGRGIFA